MIDEMRDKILDQFVDHLWSQVDIPVRNKIWEAIGIPVQQTEWQSEIESHIKENKS